MSKSVLVVDTPKDCANCLFSEFTDKDDFDCETMFCNAKKFKQGEIAKCNEIPEWCPLRPLPERKRTTSLDSLLVQARIYGYNDCIDDIFGKTK